MMMIEIPVDLAWMLAYKLFTILLFFYSSMIMLTPNIPVCISGTVITLSLIVYFGQQFD